MSKKIEGDGEVHPPVANLESPTPAASISASAAPAESQYEQYLEALKITEELKKAAIAEGKKADGKSPRYKVHLTWWLRDLNRGGDIFTRVSYEYIEGSGKCYIPSCPFNARGALNLPPFPYMLTPEQFSAVKEKLRDHWNTKMEREQEEGRQLRERIHANFVLEIGDYLPPPHSEFRVKAWINNEEITRGEWDRREEEMKQTLHDSAIKDHFFGLRG